MSKKIKNATGINCQPAGSRRVRYDDLRLADRWWMVDRL